MANTITFGSFTITDAHIYGGINHTIDLNAGDEFTVGNVASAEVSFVTDVNTVKLYSKDHSAGSFTWTDGGTAKGTFYVSEITKSQGMYTVTAYDKISLLSAPISALRITTPTTISSLIGKITTYLGCSLVGTLTNGSLQVTGLPDSGTTIRDLLGYALAYSGCSGVLNASGNLKLVYYPQSNITVSASDYKKLEAADYLCRKIDNVQILSMASDVVATYGSGTNTLFIQNPLVTACGNIEASNIYNKVKDFYYTPLTCEMFDANGIEVGTIATFGTAPTLVMSISSGIDGVIVSSVGNDDRTVSNKDTLEGIAARVNEAKELAEEAQEIAEETQTAVNNLDIRVQTAEGQLGTVETSIVNLGGRVTTAEGNISTVETAIGNPSDSASASGSLYARVKNVKSTADSAVSSINAEVTRAKAAEQSAETAAANANTAANNAGRAAAIAQAALESMGDFDDEMNYEAYFWHDNEGAHVLGDTYRTDVKDGLEVVRNSDGTVLADINPDGATFKSGNGTEIAHLGYGTTQGESGQTPSPYYDLGRRKAGTTKGSYSVAEGHNTTASGLYSHAEGNKTIASSNQSHAEGQETIASGAYGSHAEGLETTASGDYGSHAEGYGTTASGLYSHAEGRGATASDRASHAEGYGTTASGVASHAEGRRTTASGDYSHAQGKWNIDNSNHADIVGNGTADDVRSNAYALDWNGNGYYKGDVYVGCNADSSGGQKVLAGCPFPVNGIYMSMDSADPSTIWSGTTWQRISKGKVLVGVDENDTDFAANVTGGEKEVTLTTAEIPAHTHGSSGAHAHNVYYRNNLSAGGSALGLTAENYKTGTSVSAMPSGGAHTHTSVGGGQAHNNLQPYMTCYIWQRTA